MRKYIVLFIVLNLFVAQLSSAQQLLPIATNVQKAYATDTRNLSGRPGAHYWQNKADYLIKITFDPSTRQLSGTVGIDYVNNSPDTLSKVWFKLYPNLYQKSAPRAVPVAAQDLTDGVQIKSIVIDGQVLDSTKRTIRATNMIVKNKPILPHQRVHYDITYTYTVNKGSFIRTGQIDSGAFFIAYFFPRITVYDDIDGWNTYPYTGQYEFYNDFSNFKVEFTLPGDYQVWGTGNLSNAAEVYNPQIAALIAKANKNDDVTDIITTADIKAGHITVPNKANTWKFEAENITDMAFGISNHYVWKATSLVVDAKTGKRTRVDAVFNPDDKEYLRIINYARKTVDVMSYQFPGVPYPYPHETIFDGPDEMEFPMMVDNNPFKKPADAIELTAHEIFHTLFPFYVGVNETKYSFMDEGWATMAEFVFHPLIDSTIALNYDMTDVNATAGTEQDVPIMTLTPQLAGAARFADKDQKPALAYLYAKEILGDDLFFKGLRFYINQWQGKHPTPYDFFNCMNTGSGVNLNWFWKNWFFEKGVPDLAVGKVYRVKQRYTVAINNLGTEAVPVHLTVVYTDGSKQLLSASAACWATGNKTKVLSFTAIKPVKQLVLGTAYDMDVDKRNNYWEADKTK